MSSRNGSGNEFPAYKVMGGVRSGLNPALIVALSSGMACLSAAGGIWQTILKRRGVERVWDTPTAMRQKSWKQWMTDFIGYWHKSRLRRELENGLEDVLIDLTEGLRAGENLYQAVRRTCQGCNGAWRGVLSRVLMRHEGGLSLGEAFNYLEQTGSQQVMLMVRAIQIHQWSGGDLAQILFKLARTLREHRVFEDEVKSKTAESKWTAYILAGMPLMMAIFIVRMQPVAFHLLLRDSFGRVALAYATLSWAIGIICLRRILRF